MRPADRLARAVAADGFGSGGHEPGEVVNPRCVGVLRSRESRGYDAGKEVNRRKRFIVTDTLGLLLTVVVLTAGVQDRDGAKPVLLDTRLRTRVRFVFADGGFAGRLLDWARPVTVPDGGHIDLARDG